MTTTVVLQPTGGAGIDTRLSGFSTQAGLNYGTSTSFRAGHDGNGLNKGLVKFDLSSIPSNAYIVSATLTLTVSSRLADAVVSIHRSLVQWYEGSQNALAPTAGQDGSTYNLRNANGSVAWAGGAGGGSGSDYAATATDSKTMNANTAFDWNVKADVQGFVDGTYTNHGWWVIAPNTASNAAIFSTSDAASGQPKLTIEYGIIQTLTLSPTADVTIRQTNPDINYGLDTGLYHGNDSSNLSAKSLIRFNLTGIPASLTVISAKLRLYALSELNSTDRTTFIYRMLVDWYEGVGDGVFPSSGDRTTWNYRNANGSVAWPSGAGGGSAGNGVESAVTETTSATFAATGVFIEFDVKADVEAFAAGTYTNYGWWIRGQAATSAMKTYASRNNATSSVRPELVIQYVSDTVLIEGDSSGSSTVAGTLSAKGYMTGNASGSSLVAGELLTNEFISGDSSGSSLVEGTIKGVAGLVGSSSGSSALAGTLRSQIFIPPGNADGSSLVEGHLKGIYRMVGEVFGSSTVSAEPSFQGQLRGNASGSTLASATGYAKAVGVARVIGCNPTPLLYITDGSVKSNGQLNMVNLLSTRRGYKLKSYRPPIAQYKDGGRWSSSPNAQGRRLTSRVFDNAIEVYELSAIAEDQDALIEYQQELLAFQEAAADFWSSKWVAQPIYLVRKAARESNTQYGIIHIMNVPELENPYAQPFFDHKVAAIETLTLRVERGHWLATPPGQYECVPISSQRSWTVSGWQSGS